MNSIYIDSKFNDEKRRQYLYDGQLFVYSPRPSSLAFTNWAAQMIKDAFGKEDPTTAQFDMPVEEFVRIFAPLKPAFIHHPETKRLIQAMLKDFGCDMETTYLDVPRLRAVTSDAYLTSGVGYAHHLHRDTWYSAPMCQLNWWLPIFEMSSESSMAYHPKYWNEAVKNGSSKFNYYNWNAHQPRGCRQAHQVRHPRAAQARAAHGTRSPGPLDQRTRRSSDLFRGSNALDRAQHIRQNPVQHRFPDRQPDRREGQERRSQPGFASHWNLAPRLHEGYRSEPNARGIAAAYDSPGTADGVKVYRPEVVGAR